MSNTETKGGSSGGANNPNVNAAPSSDDSEVKSITAYDVFEKCIVRTENLISVNDSTKEIEAISEEHYCDCYRAVVVLTISALDAFAGR